MGLRHLVDPAAGPLGLWRNLGQHWPLRYEPGLWSIVLPHVMYSVAAVSLGKVARLAFMEPLGRVMLWGAMAAWAAVALAFLASLPQRRQR